MNKVSSKDILDFDFKIKIKTIINIRLIINWNVCLRMRCDRNQMISGMGIWL